MLRVTSSQSGDTTNESITTRGRDLECKIMNASRITRFISKRDLSFFKRYRVIGQMSD